MAHIFLCYASEDQERVEEIYGRLQRLGFKPWMDKRDLLPGQDWDREIRNALRASDFVLVFLSRNSVAKRGYVQREFKLALGTLEEVPDGAIHTIPVRLDDCDVPEQFEFLQWCNLFEDDGFERIMQAIQVGLSQRQRPGPESTSQSLWPETLCNSIGIEFVLIPAGEFMMGMTDGDDDECPVHMVRISQPFYLGKYQVTQAQWEAVMESNPSRFTGDSNKPVEQVPWEDAQEFIRRLNAKEEGTKHRLPTEAEWEYVARAGSKAAYSFGNGSSRLSEYAWYRENASGGTRPVGQLKPNAWGVYDMHGNIWEWVQDWYGEYPAETVTDPQGPSSGSRRAYRDGSWVDNAEDCRSVHRGGAALGPRLGFLGVRLLRTTP